MSNVKNPRRNTTSGLVFEILENGHQWIFGSPKSPQEVRLTLSSKVQKSPIAIQA
jgi:hypothetical protein